MSTKRKRYVLVGIFAAVALGVGIPTVLASGGGGPNEVGAVGPASTSGTFSGPCDLTHSMFAENESGTIFATSSTSYSQVDNGISVSFNLPGHPTKPHDPHPPAPWHYCITVQFSGQVAMSNPAQSVYCEPTLDNSVAGLVPSNDFFHNFCESPGSNANFFTPFGVTYWFPSVLAGDHTIRMQWKNDVAGTANLKTPRILVSWNDPNNN